MTTRRAWMLFLVAQAAAAQRGPVVKLPAPDKSLTEEFSSIVGVRELKDGRVLVSDDRESRVVVADLAKGTVQLVGRAGNGPGEYRRIRALIAMPGDSTLMPQDDGGTWIVFAGAAPPVLWNADQSIGGSKYAIVSGVDAKGNVLLGRMGGTRTGFRGLDSLDHWLHTRSTHKEELAGKGGSPFGAAPGGTAAPRLSERAVVDPASGRPTPAGFYLADRAALFPDGWVAFARLQPYRVDWRDPAGKTITGPVLLPQREMGDGDKKAWLKWESVRSGKPQRELNLITNWPEYMPAFSGASIQINTGANPLLAAPDGQLWIERTVTAADAGQRYDIIDRRGTLVGIVALPLGERILGFGSKSIYTSITDDNGIQKLQRHPWSWGGAVKP